LGGRIDPFTGRKRFWGIFCKKVQVMREKSLSIKDPSQTGFFRRSVYFFCGFRCKGERERKKSKVFYRTY